MDSVDAILIFSAKIELINKHIQNTKILKTHFSFNIINFLFKKKYNKKKIEINVMEISGIAGPVIRLNGSNINKDRDKYSSLLNIFN